MRCNRLPMTSFESLYCDQWWQLSMVLGKRTRAKWHTADFPSHWFHIQSNFVCRKTWSNKFSIKYRTLLLNLFRLLMRKMDWLTGQRNAFENTISTVENMWLSLHKIIDFCKFKSFNNARHKLTAMEECDFVSRQFDQIQPLEFCFG